MERTKRSNHSDTIRWINRGGPFRMGDGTVIQSGKTFEAPASAVPKAFQDVISPVDPVLRAQRPVLEVAAVSYQLQQRPDTDFYDVLDGNGKRINERDLNKDEAQSILDRLG